MADPTTTNKTAQTTNSILDTLNKWLTELAIKVVSGYVPWLNIWPLSSLFHWIVMKGEAGLTKIEKQYVDAGIFEAQKQIKIDEAKNAKVDLQNAIEAKDPDAIRKASEAFNEKYKNLIHYGGSVTNAH